jgi:protocatechuate 4,5-dioxygenase alpha chain
MSHYGGETLRIASVISITRWRDRTHCAIPSILSKYAANVSDHRSLAMTHATHPDVHIPGTYMFDGKAAMKGYALNKMCFSFNSKDTREEFLKDESAYCTKYCLNDEQRAAIKARNVLALIHAGGCIYYLAKFAGIFGLTVQDVGAQQTGMSVEDFKKMVRSQGD